MINLQRSKFRSGRGRSVPHSRLPYWTPAFIAPVRIVKPIRFNSHACSHRTQPILRTRIVRDNVTRHRVQLARWSEKKIRESTTYLITSSDSSSTERAHPFILPSLESANEPIDRNRSTNKKWRMAEMGITARSVVHRFFPAEVSRISRRHREERRNRWERGAEYRCVR